jgi:hypothetical protein
VLEELRWDGGRGSAPTAWISFGAELNGLGLSAEEEETLGGHVKAALAVARLVRLRDSSLAGTEVEAAPDGRMKQGGAWVAIGMELIGLDLSAEEEGRLDLQSKASLAAARMFIARGGLDPGNLESARDAQSKRWGARPLAAALGGGVSGGVELEAAAAGHSGRRRGPWVSLGMELCGLGLSVEEEEALDPHSKAAMAAARVMLHRRSIAGTDSEAALDGQSRLAGAPSSWIDFGSQLAGQGLSAEEEAALDPHSRAALAVVRVLALRGNLGGTDVEVAPGSQSRRAGKKKAPMSFGLDLSRLGFTVEEEAALDSQSKVSCRLFVQLPHTWACISVAVPCGLYLTLRCDPNCMGCSWGSSKECGGGSLCEHG